MKKSCSINIGHGTCDANAREGDRFRVGPPFRPSVRAHPCAHARVHTMHAHGCTRTLVCSRARQCCVPSVGVATCKNIFLAARGPEASFSSIWRLVKTSLSRCQLNSHRNKAIGSIGEPAPPVALNCLFRVCSGNPSRWQ